MIRSRDSTARSIPKYPSFGSGCTESGSGNETTSWSSHCVYREVFMAVKYIRRLALINFKVSSLGIDCLVFHGHLNFKSMDV